MESYGMLGNIKAHSITVEKVARIIAEALIKAGADISMEKVTAGALMHDIGKTSCLGSGYDHSKKGAEICAANNLEEICDIVKEHVALDEFNPNGNISEKEIVYYADKRVDHDMPVGLDKRMESIIERYDKGKPEFRALVENNFKICKQVEKKIFSTLEFGPEDLKGLIDKDKK
jgi:putative nucleotidyltransferase with HDIG domain